MLISMLARHSSGLLTADRWAVSNLTVISHGDHALLVQWKTGSGPTGPGFSDFVVEWRPLLKRNSSSLLFDLANRNQSSLLLTGGFSPELTGSLLLTVGFSPELTGSMLLTGGFSPELTGCMLLTVVFSPELTGSMLPTGGFSLELIGSMLLTSGFSQELTGSMLLTGGFSPELTGSMLLTGGFKLRFIIHPSRIDNSKIPRQNSR